MKGFGTHVSGFWRNVFGFKPTAYVEKGATSIKAEHTRKKAQGEYCSNETKSFINSGRLYVGSIREKKNLKLC